MERPQDLLRVPEQLQERQPVLLEQGLEPAQGLDLQQVLRFPTCRQTLIL